MASDSEEILKSGTERVTVQQNSIPSPLPHQTPEKIPVSRGFFQEWDRSRHGSAAAYSHSLLTSPTSEKIPVSRGFFQEWDGSLYDSTAQYSHSTAAPNMGEFSRLRGNSREWDGSLYCSATAYSHCTAAPKHRKKYPFRGDFFESGMDRVTVQLHIIPTRSCQKFSKQICLWDLDQIIYITFIIQIV